MAKNGAITATTFTDRSSFTGTAVLKIKQTHITELQNAITRLNTYAANVDNCGYTNCCQSCQNACNQCTDKCEKCQETCACQSNKCEKCQETCACQSNKCEKCQETCACQSCQVRYNQ